MIGGALGCGAGPPDSLKGTCMNLSGVEGETECAVTTPGEPAPAQHITGEVLDSVPEDKWELKAALSAAGSPCRGQGKQNSHRASPSKGFVLSCVTSRNVTRDFLSR